MSAEPLSFDFMREPEGRTLEERFNAYHEANKGILAAIIQVARDRKANDGYKSWSISGVFEVLRFAPEYRELRMRLQISQADGFMLNNSYRAFYSRLAEKAAPDLEGFFEKRKSQADN